MIVKHGRLTVGIKIISGVRNSANGRAQGQDWGGSHSKQDNGGDDDKDDH